MTDKNLNEVLDRLDQLAMADDPYQYGLPLLNEEIAEVMRFCLRGLISDVNNQWRAAMDAVLNDPGCTPFAKATVDAIAEKMEAGK